MKKPKLVKLSKPKLAKLKLPKVPRLRKQQLGSDEKFTEALQNLPRITNDTVAEHREEVLSSARKYIYPLRHSKRRVVVITAVLLIVAVLGFFSYCVAALYKFQSTSGFMYGVTRVIPFPVAKVGSSWVSYESYLFELRHTVHYYQTQQVENFSTPAGKQHLKKLKQDALQQVIQDAYVKQLAAQHHVSVSDQDVNNEVALVRAQNRLGSSDKVFQNVLSEFWGWTPADFQRELKQQLLAQKVAAALDTKTTARANAALKQLQTGADFAKLAAEVSDDKTTSQNGGQYGSPITASDQSIAPQVIAALTQLKPGQYSGIINTGYTLEIDKLISVSGPNITAAHIVFNIQDISTFTRPLQKAEPPRQFIHVL